MDKILTLVIPTYNMERYLHKCLDSLIVSDESMKILEVLVINDGSKDSSSEIAHEYKNRFSQTFRVIDKENGNYGSCINRGLNEASGKYIKILDADDYLDNSILELFLVFLKSSEEDIIFSDFAYVDEEDNIISEFKFNLPIGRLFSLREIPTEMVPHLAHYSVTYKKELFNRFDYKQTEGISYTDDEWVLKPALWAKDTSFFPHVLYHYLRGREGQTFDPNVIKKSLEQRVIVAKEMLTFYENNISKCYPDNKKFVTDKLSGRLKSLYNYHLVRFPSSKNNKRIIEFDKYLKYYSPRIYECLNDVTNNCGWHYIRQWRKMGYSCYSPALLIIRLKRSIINKRCSNGIIIDKIPTNIKRSLS